MGSVVIFVCSVTVLADIVLWLCLYVWGLNAIIAWRLLPENVKIPWNKQMTAGESDRKELG